MKNPLLAPLFAWLGRLRHPQLFAILAVLFAVDLAVPDLIPLADEILLGLGTMFLGAWKRRREAPDAPR